MIDTSQRFPGAGESTAGLPLTHGSFNAYWDGFIKKNRYRRGDLMAAANDMKRFLASIPDDTAEKG
jgi:hypothetical protein